jgi:hypothetical protein
MNSYILVIFLGVGQFLITAVFTESILTPSIIKT